MFNRLRKLNGIGRAFFDSLSFAGQPPVVNPPYGTVLSTACGSEVGQGQPDNYYDALGNPWNGMFKKYNLIADGNGGSMWVGVSDNANPCYYPYGYVTSGVFDGAASLSWNYGGVSGTYVWGVTWDYYYSDGAGGEVHTAGVIENNPQGWNISGENNWAEGYMAYVSVGQSAFWYNYGYYLGDHFYSNDYTTDCWTVSIGGYTNYIYADGYGGTFESFAGGGWNSSGIIGYCNDYEYYHDGNGNVTSNYVGGGGGGGSSYPSYGTYLDGGSSPITTNISYDGYVDGNYQSNNTDISIGYSYSNNYADGNGGSYNESGSYYDYADGSDIFTAPYGTELKTNWDYNGPDGSYNGTFKWADEVGVWKINQGSTYMDRLYVAPLVSDGHVIWESPGWAGEGGQYKTQIILQNGAWFSTTITF